MLQPQAKYVLYDSILPCSSIPAKDKFKNESTSVCQTFEQLKKPTQSKNKGRQRKEYY